MELNWKYLNSRVKKDPIFVGVKKKKKKKNKNITETVADKI